MQKKIAELEGVNLSEKSWKMGGETSAKRRPLNRSGSREYIVGVGWGDWGAFGKGS
jgi:hypothetical protein